MKITVKFMGPLQDYVGEQTVRFDLSDPVTYGTLLKEIGDRFGNRFPAKIWDTNGGGFKAGILIMGKGRDLSDPETPLMENEEIKILPLLGGG